MRIDAPANDRAIAPPASRRGKSWDPIQPIIFSVPFVLFVLFVYLLSLYLLLHYAS